MAGERASVYVGLFILSDMNNSSQANPGTLQSRPCSFVANADRHSQNMVSVGGFLAFVIAGQRMVAELFFIALRDALGTSDGLL